MRGLPCVLSLLSPAYDPHPLQVALLDFWPTPEALGEVARLPDLRCLDLSWLAQPHTHSGGWAGHGGRAGWAGQPQEAQQACMRGLARLGGLRELRLKHCGIRSLVPELLTMPNLQVGSCWRRLGRGAMTCGSVAAGHSLPALSVLFACVCASCPGPATGCSWGGGPQGRAVARTAHGR
jgi:hypothetical protein